MNRPQQAPHHDHLGSLSHAIAAHLPMIRKRIRAQIGRTPDLEDLVQETITRAIESGATLSDPRALRPWIMTIATRTAIDHVRRERQKPQQTSMESETVDPAWMARSPERTAEELDFWHMVLAELRRLPKHLHDVGNRHFIEGESLGTIGRAHGRRKSTVQTQAQRVREALSARLGEAGYAGFLPLIDLAAPQPVATLGAAHTGYSASAPQAVGIAIGTSLLLAIIVWLGNLLHVSTPNESPSSVIGNPIISDDQQPLANESSDKTVEKRQSVASNDTEIQGRVLDAATKVPIEGAIVYAFDYRHLSETRTRTDAAGHFRVAASHGARWPFAVLVEAPDPDMHARRLLRSLLPSSGTQEILLDRPISFSLTAWKDFSTHPTQVANCDIALIDLAGIDEDWPFAYGESVRDLLPSHFSIIDRRIVPGIAAQVVFRHASPTPLGISVIDHQGNLWLGALDDHMKMRSTASPDNPQRSIPEVHVALETWRPTTARNILQTTTDDAISLALRTSAWRTIDVSKDLLLNFQRNLRPRHAEQRPMLNSLAALWDPIDSPKSAGLSASLSVDLNRLITPQDNQRTDNLTVLLENAGWEEFLIDYATSRPGEVLTFDRVPCGTPVKLSIFADDFGHRILSLPFCIPQSWRGTVDLASHIKDVRVRTVGHEERLPIHNVSIPMIVDGILTRVWILSDTPVDTAMTSTAFVDPIHISAEFGTDTVLGQRVSARPGQVGTVDFDIRPSFTISVRNRDGIFDNGNVGEIVIQGFVEGEQRVYFRHTPGKGRLSDVRIHPGAIGKVHGEILHFRPGVSLPKLPRRSTFNTTSSIAGDLIPVQDILLLPESPRDHTLAIRLHHADGLISTPTITHIRVRERPRPIHTALGLSAEWTTIPWSIREYAVHIAAPERIAGSEIEIITDELSTIRTHAPETPFAPSTHIDILVSRSSELILRQNGLLHYHSGLQADDVIISVAGLDVHTHGELQTALRAAKDDDPLPIVVLRNHVAVDILLSPPWRTFMGSIDVTAR